MTEPSYLTNQLLIAMPGMEDPNFSHTVTLICEHTDMGAMGIVINRPTQLHLVDVLEHMQIKIEAPAKRDQVVFQGGPVEEERGFVLHPGGGRWDSSMPVSDSISITTSRDVLEAIARDQGPSKSLVALGYAGWQAGQLEAEIQRNAWLSGPADEEILFELPIAQRWEAAARLLGVDLNLLSSEAGHA
jgi:putative transcriptional regulator